MILAKNCSIKLRFVFLRFAGGIAAVITSPLEVLKTRLQVKLLSVLCTLMWD